MTGDTQAVGLVRRLLEAPNQRVADRIARRGPGTGSQAAELLGREMQIRIREDLAACRPCLRAATAIARADGGPAARGWELRLRGVHQHLAGQSAASGRDLRRAGKLFESCGSYLEAGDTYRILIQVFTLGSRFDDAERAVSDAMRCYRRSGRTGPRQRAGVAMNRGNLLHARENLRAGLASYRKAARQFGEAGDFSRQAQARFNEANLLVSLDRCAQARKLYREVRESFDRGGQPALVLQADYALASLDLLEGLPDPALRRLRKIRRRQLESGDSWGVAHTELEMGQALLLLNRANEAAELARRAEKIFHRAGHRVEAAACRSVSGSACLALGRPGTAARHFERARREYEQAGSGPAAAWAGLGSASAELRRGNTRTAAKEARAAENIFRRERRPSRRCQALLLLARCAFDQGRLTRALDRARQALAIARRLKSARLELEIQALLARVSRRRRDPAGEFRHLRRAEHCIELMRPGVGSGEGELSFLLDKSEVYEGLIRNRLERGGSAARREALHFAERSKARALADRVRRGGLSAAVPSESRRREILERLERIERELAVSEARIDRSAGGGQTRSAQLARLTARRSAVLDELGRVDPAAGALSGARLPGLEEVLPKLERDELVVEYTAVNGRYHLFLADRRGVRTFGELARESELSDLIERLRFQLGKDVLGAGHASRHGDLISRICRGYLQELERRLLAPISWMLEGRRVCIVPHGSLHGLPFHAFENHEGRALADRCEVSYAPSLGVLHLLRQRSRAAEGQPLILGAGDDAAPQIEEEVRFLDGLLDRARTFRGAAAQRDAIELAQHSPPLLHIASHGVFSEGGQSALQLGDGLITAGEIQQLSGMAALVVLSGCQTGRGTVHSGDELVGLARGFFVAGARTIVASLWEVHDRSAFELMREFYSLLAAGSTVGQALCEAQRRARRRDTNPLRWAPFVVLGDATLRLDERIAFAREEGIA